MPKKISTKRTNLFSNYNFLHRRELGFQKKLGFGEDLATKLTSSLDICNKSVKSNVGGIFNLEFSLNGAILAAACEKKSIYLYDSLSQRLIQRIENAHTNCVNCIRFLDQYAFASGSDDATIKLWDMRFLKEPTRTLRGHTNWVKNIEQCPVSGKLLTSAFDGSILSWDLNNYTESGVISNRILTMDGLVRMKINPDGSKMIICTTSGYMMIIHNLNLEYLSSDLQRFRPNLYRLMQISEQNIPAASSFTHLFELHRNRNRVELISDFPNDAEVISSLQIHPMGWCVLTRNINEDELSEWTCIHDIQEIPNLNKKQHLYDRDNEIDTSRITPGIDTRNPMDVWMGLITNQNIREQRMRMPPENRGTGIRTNRTSVTVLNSGIFSNNQFEHTDRYCIVQNHSRLIYFSEEPNLGKGFIKEVCFSTDGRIICSPYDTGIRLFAFNNKLNELSMCVPERPQKLTMVAHYKDYHPEIVVSCKFNPFHCILVSGCLGGQISWYQPVF